MHPCDCVTNNYVSEPMLSARDSKCRLHYQQLTTIIENYNIRAVLFDKDVGFIVVYRMDSIQTVETNTFKIIQMCVSAACISALL